MDGVFGTFQQTEGGTIRVKQNYKVPAHTLQNETFSIENRQLGCLIVVIEPVVVLVFTVFAPPIPGQPTGIGQIRSIFKYAAKDIKYYILYLLNV